MRKSLTPYMLPGALALLFFAQVLSHSCANTTQAPTGGDKDTIPPVMLKTSPAPMTVQMPLHGAEFSFTFNEYVKIKNAQSIFVSPPLEKKPKAKIRGKSVVISFESDLQPNTTYTVDLNDAIVDNNEGNAYPGYTFVFSTGDSIDSLCICGVVQDCNTLMPVKGATVLLHKDHADSSLFLHPPFAAARTDDWGFFVIRNIPDTLYRLYALIDSNNDLMYQQDGERVAFLDSAIRPTVVVNDSLPELRKYDMKDTLACQARKPEYELNVFREKPLKQYIVNKERISDRSSYITFMAQRAHIDTMWISGVPANKLITQFNIERDSLEIWVNDRREMPDTFRLYVNYRKTDSLGVASPFTEEIKLVNPVPARQRRLNRRNLKHEDTTCVFSLKADPETVEQLGFQMEFNYPIINENFDSLTLRVVNPRQQESIGKYSVEPDSTNIRRYTVRPEVELQEGFEYFLKVPHRAFRDINGFWSDSTDVKVSLPTDEKLSTLSLEMTGVGGNTYIVDLLSEKRDKVLRSYVISSDRVLPFPYLKAGKYCIRITEDRNHNSIVDSGSLLEHRQPEKVRFYKFGEDVLLVVREMTEIDQSVDLAELFKD